MTTYIADTHAVVWYLLDAPELSTPAKISSFCFTLCLRLLPSGKPDGNVGKNCVNGWHLAIQRTPCAMRCKAGSRSIRSRAFPLRRAPCADNSKKKVRRGVDRPAAKAAFEFIRCVRIVPSAGLADNWESDLGFVLLAQHALRLHRHPALLCIQNPYHTLAASDKGALIVPQGEIVAAAAFDTR